MFDQGYFAYRDDPISLFFNRLINGFLRSQIVCLGMISVFSFLAIVTVWNQGVDIYVRTHGIPYEAPVIADTVDAERNHTVTFRFANAAKPDSWRLIEPAFRGPASDTASVTMIASPRKACHEAGAVQIYYLREAPGVFIVKGDLFASLYRPFIAILSVLITVACVWNFSRISAGKPALALPTWSQWNGTYS